MRGDESHSIGDHAGSFPAESQRPNDSPCDEEFPELVGQYALLSRIEGGGFGVVFKAVHIVSGEEVAVKILRRELAAVPEVVERFKREAVLAGQLLHHHIVPVRACGISAGHHYLVMPFVDGINLRRYAGARPLPAHRAAEIVSQAAKACHYAHTRPNPVIHRDIKPANILLENETGRALVTDFGLAKQLTLPNGWTRSRQPLGTAHYMAPEQADPDLGPTSAAGDVYSLGATLYELLTGRPPFPLTAGGASESLEHQILWERPRRPRSIYAEVPRDLETICLKCLEKVPVDRYPTAAALADDLGRFQAGKPIDARLPGPVRRYQLLWQRRPALAASLTALILSLFTGAAAARFYAHQAHLNGQDAQRAGVRAVIADQRTRQQAAETDRQKDARLWQGYLTDMQDIAPLWESGDTARIREILARNAAPVGREDRRGIEWYYWSNRLAGNGRWLRHEVARYRSLAISPDNSRLAAADREHVAVWDLQRGEWLYSRPIRSGRPSNIQSSDIRTWDQSLDFSPDGTRLAATSFIVTQKTRAGSLRILDTASGNTIFSVQDDPELAGRAVAFTPDGQQVLAGGYNNAWFGFDVATGKPWSPSKTRRQTAGFSRALGPAALDGPATPKFSPTPFTDREVVWTLRFTDDQRQLLSGCDALPPYVWEWPAGKIDDYATSHWRNRPAGPTGLVLSTRPAPFSARLTNDDLELVQPISRTDRGRPTAVRQLDPIHQYTTLTVQRQFLAAAGAEGIVRAWLVPEFGAKLTNPEEYRGQERPIICLAFSPDGQNLLSADSAGAILLQSTRPTGIRLPGGPALTPIEYGTFSSIDGLFMARFDRQGQTLAIQQVHDHRTLARFPATRVPAAVCFSPKGAFAAVSFSNFAATLHGLQKLSPTAEVHLLDLRNGKSLALFQPLRVAQRWAISFSDDETRFAVAMGGQGTALFDLRSQATSTIPAESEVLAVSLSPTGRLLGTGSVTGSAILRVDGAKEVFHTDIYAQRFVFGPGERLAGLFNDDAAANSNLVADLGTGAILPTTLGNDWLIGLCFSLDGRRAYVTRSRQLDVYATNPWVRLVSIPVEGRTDYPSNIIQASVNTLLEQWRRGVNDRAQTK